MGETAVTFDLVLPQLGETVTEGTITSWFKGPGDSVEVDELVYEVSTEKVDSEVPSPVAGVIVEILVEEGETVDVGTVLARMAARDGQTLPPTQAPAAADTAGPAATSVGPPAGDVSASQSATDAGANGVAPTPQPAGEPAVQPAAAGTTEPVSQPTSEPDGLLVSPLVRRLLRENNLSVSQVEGTGVSGRITRADVLDAIDRLHRGESAAAGTAPAAASTAPTSQAPTQQPTQLAAAPPAAPAAVPPGGFEPFNNIRRRTGEHMVRSLATSAHVLTVMEVDYEAVEVARRQHKDSWKRTEGSSLTYLPFVVVATAEALTRWPRINATVGEADGKPGVQLAAERNIGIAVDLDHQGLIVPVLRAADTLNLRGAARAIETFAQAARSKKLSPDDVTGATFTISNNGSFGTYTTAAVINQPQVAVLSTDGVARRPVVVRDRHGGESIAIHSVGHLCLSWDHRAFDGAYAASFLGDIKHTLETHDWENEL